MKKIFVFAVIGCFTCSVNAFSLRKKISTHTIINSTTINKYVLKFTEKNIGKRLTIFSDKKVEIWSEGYVSETINSLRYVLNPQTNVLYFTKDNGGGIWYYDNRDKYDVDNTGTVIVSINGKRFKRIGNPTLDSFGAVGNGTTDDTQAIKKAIKSTSDGKSVLIIPEKTYLVNGNVEGSNKVLLPIYTNTHIRGVGRNSIIKVADDLTSKGDYKLFGPAENDNTSNVTLENFTVDMNGEHNLVKGSKGAAIRKAYTVYINNGRNITLTKLNILSNPGRNVFVLGDNGSKSSVTNAQITYNTFKNSGGSIPGNELQNDHSTIYSQCDTALIAYNQLRNDSPINPTYIANKVVTGLEIHGSNTKVINNKVTNYTHGGNVVAAIQNSINNYWSGNVFFNCTKLGLSLWSISPYKNMNCTISNNTIQLYGLFASEIGGIYQSPLLSNTTSIFENLKITDNKIYSTDMETRRSVWDGISICAASGVEIRNNFIQNVKGNGISIVNSNKDFDISDVKIVNNTISNTGLNTFGGMVYSIFVNNKSAAASFKNIQVDSNKVDKPGTSTSSMRRIKIMGNGRLDKVNVGAKNTFKNVIQ